MLVIPMILYYAEYGRVWILTVFKCTHCPLCRVPVFLPQFLKPAKCLWTKPTGESDLFWLLSSSSPEDAQHSAGEEHRINHQLIGHWVNWSCSSFFLLSHLQIFNVEFLLIDVGSVSPSSQSGHGGQVPAVSPHSLYDEHSTLRPCSRLLDSVTGLHNKNRARC